MSLLVARMHPMRNSDFEKAIAQHSAHLETSNLHHSNCNFRIKGGRKATFFLKLNTSAWKTSFKITKVSARSFLPSFLTLTSGSGCSGRNYQPIFEIQRPKYHIRGQLNAPSIFRKNLEEESMSNQGIRNPKGVAACWQGVQSTVSTMAVRANEVLLVQSKSCKDME